MLESELSLYEEAQPAAGDAQHSARERVGAAAYLFADRGNPYAQQVLDGMLNSNSIAEMQHPVVHPLLHVRTGLRWIRNEHGYRTNWRANQEHNCKNLLQIVTVPQIRELKWELCRANVYAFAAAGAYAAFAPNDTWKFLASKAAVALVAAVAAHGVKAYKIRNSTMAIEEQVNTLKNIVEPTPEPTPNLSYKPPSTNFDRPKPWNGDIP